MHHLLFQRKQKLFVSKEHNLKNTTGCCSSIIHYFFLTPKGLNIVAQPKFSERERGKRRAGYDTTQIPKALKGRDKYCYKTRNLRIATNKIMPPPHRFAPHDHKDIENE